MIAAVDPGTKQSALVLFDAKRQKIVDMGLHANADLLKMLRFLPKRVTVFTIELVASFGFAVGHEIFDTVLWSGRFIEAVTCPLYPLYRKQVVAHFAAKNDSTLRAALIERFGDATGCVYDLWSALGLAACASDLIAAGVPAQPLHKNLSGGVESRHAAVDGERRGNSMTSERVVINPHGSGSSAPPAQSSSRRLR